jgi:hypothetical protein
MTVAPSGHEEIAKRRKISNKKHPEDGENDDGNYKENLKADS